MKKIERRVLILVGIVSLHLTGTFAAEPRHYKSVQNEINTLRQDVSELSLALRSLHSFKSKAEGEVLFYKEQFQHTIQDLIGSIMDLPSISSLVKVKSWVEFQHAELLKEAVKKRAAREPLQWIAQWKKKVSELDQLETELLLTKKNLESKQVLLNLEMEDLKIMEQRMAKPRKL